VVFGDGTDQRSMVRQIIITFSEPVNFTANIAAAFTLHRSGPGGAIGDVVLMATPTSVPTGSVTLTFSGPLTENGSLIDGRYDFTIDAAQVWGIAGALDGNNDGVAGGDYTIIGSAANRFYRLFGDSNGDGRVDA